MDSMTTFLGFIALAILVQSIAGHAVVQTTSGRVEGQNFNSTWGVVTQFFGIPYAEAPIGKNRFKVSQGITTARVYPTGSTSDTADQNHFGNVQVNSETPPLPCPQFPQWRYRGNESAHLDVTEDCLNLNVYVPGDFHASSASEKLPILVFIPGSNFSEADASMYDGSSMAAMDRIIVVTVNYRVGVFGYLSTGNATIRGNAGISDILSALEWVRANGDVFGGDVSRTTVAGAFHGAIALSAAVTSPRFLRKGQKKDPLALRVILHGGVGTGRWTVEENPMLPFTKLAGMSDCLPQKSIDDVVACLQEVPIEVLLKKSNRVPEIWRPVIDNVLVLGRPLERIEFGQFPDSVDVMIGENSGCGSMCFQEMYRRNSPLVRKLEQDIINEEDLDNLVEASLNEFYKVDDMGLASVVAHEYLYPGVAEKSLRQTYQHFCGTLFIRAPMEQAARYISRFQNDVFRYEFAYNSKFSTTPEWFGVGIGDETVFLFPPNGTEFTFDDLRVFQDFRGSVVNFIKKGNPSISPGYWPQFDEETKTMIVFRSDGMKLTGSRFLNRDVHFWREAIPPLLKSLKIGMSCKNPDGLRKQCTRFHSTDPEASCGISTSVYLIIFIIVGICALLIISMYFYFRFKRHKILFQPACDPNLF